MQQLLFAQEFQLQNHLQLLYESQLQQELLPEPESLQVLQLQEPESLQALQLQEQEPQLQQSSQQQEPGQATLSTAASAASEAELTSSCTELSVSAEVLASEECSVVG